LACWTWLASQSREEGKLQFGLSGFLIQIPTFLHKFPLFVLVTISAFNYGPRLGVSYLVELSKVKVTLLVAEVKKITSTVLLFPLKCEDSA
jgi:hypothetical protein